MPATLTAPLRQPDPLGAAFAQLRQASPAWMQPLRQAAWARFLKRGLPTTRDEDWRFTSLAALPLAPARPGPAPRMEGAVFGTLPGPCLVFVNGHFAPSLSHVGTLPKGVKITHRAAQWAQEHADGCDETATATPSQHEGPFEALNAAFHQDGALIELAEDAELSEPLRLFFIHTATEDGSMASLRHRIIAGPRSRATVIEAHLGQTHAAYFNNSLTEIHAAAEARVEHLRFQDESAAAIHVGTLSLRLAAGSHVAHHSLLLGARLARCNLRARLEGERADCLLNGMCLGAGTQVLDHHMVMEHVSRHCESREFFNGILDDESRGVFHGRIHVHPGAVKTDAKQTNRNLLLSGEATANTKPQLEIYADDVRCTHGATVGQMNPDQVFYLRARGISQESAQRMLVHAFAGEIIDRIACQPAREELDRLVWDRLEQNPHIAA